MTASKTVTNTAYYLEIYDLDAGSLIADCGSGKTCSTSVSRLQTGASHYVGRVALRSQTLEPAAIQAKAGPISVSLAPFTATFSASDTVVTTSSSSTLTLTSNQPVDSTPYYLEIFDADTGSLVTDCGVGVSCTTTISIVRSGPRNFVARIADYGTALEPTEIQAQAGPVSVTLAPLTLSMTESSHVVSTTSSSTITLTTNQDISGTPYYIQLFDADTRGQVANCGEGTTCSTDVFETAAGVHHFVGRLALFGSSLDPDDVQASAGPVSVSLQRYTLTLEAGKDSSGNQVLTATTNQDLSNTPYFIEIYGSNGDEIANCGTATTCSGYGDRQYSGYIAYVAPPSSTGPPDDIQAVATPTGSMQQLPGVPLTESEFQTTFATGDDGDVDANYHPTGDAYRDLITGYGLVAFSSLHDKAVSLRYDRASSEYAHADVRADTGARRGISIAGAGRTGGTGYPDLSALTATDLSLWEVKYGSATGEAAGAYQLSRYIAKAQTDPNFPRQSVAPGSPFGESDSGPADVLGTPFTVTVTSSATPGVELYTVDDGMQKVFATVKAYVEAQCEARVCATQASESNGKLTETQTSSGFTISLDGTQLLTGTIEYSPAQSLYVYDYVVV